jgi:hypothetical protein
LKVCFIAMSAAQIKKKIDELTRVIQMAQKEKDKLLSELAKIEEKDADLACKETTIDILEFVQKIKINGGLIVPQFNSSDKVWIEFLTDNPYIVKLSISVLQATQASFYQEKFSFCEDDLVDPDHIPDDASPDGWEPSEFARQVLVMWFSKKRIHQHGLFVFKLLICKATVAFFLSFQMKGLVEFTTNPGCNCESPYIVIDGTFQPKRCGSCNAKRRADFNKFKDYFDPLIEHGVSPSYVLEHLDIFATSVPTGEPN